jgi:hypothetical protein
MQTLVSIVDIMRTGLGDGFTPLHEQTSEDSMAAGGLKWTIAEPPPVSETAQHRVAWRGLFTVCCLFLLFATLPFNLNSHTAGLDSSWRTGLNLLVHSRYLFGRDWVFTYGPLGYLLAPQDVGHNLIVANGFALVLHALLGVGLITLIWHAQRWTQVTLFLVVYALGVAMAPLYETQTLVVAAVLLAVALSGSRLALPAAVAEGLLAAGLLFMKLSLGVTVIAMIVVAIAATLLVQRPVERTRLRPILALVASLLLGVAMLLIAYVRTIAGLAGAASASLQIVHGYGVAMTTLGSTTVLLLGIGVVLCMGVTAFFLRRAQDPSFALAAAFTVGALFLFREGFVRQDWLHELQFFSPVLCLAAILVLAPRKYTAVSVSVVGVIACSLMSLAAVRVGSLADGRNGVDPGQVLTGEEGWRHLDSLVHLSASRASGRAASEQALVPDRLPDGWLSSIGAGHGTVDAVPWEINVIAANHLSWVPSPTLQLYAAYTAALDRADAAHFRSPHAPDFLVMQFADIDGRNPLLSAPATWRAIMDSYDLAGMDPAGGFLLLHRKPAAPAAPLQTLGTSRARAGDTISVPEAGGPVYAQIDTQLTPLGMVKSELFRIAPVSLELNYASGQSAVYRVTPDTLQNGVLINYLPQTGPEFAGLLSRRATDRVTSFRLVGPGLASYDSGLTVHWLSAPISVAYTSAEQVAGLPKVATGLSLSVDQIDGAPAPPGEATVSLKDGAGLSVLGWAIDPRENQAAGSVFLNIDGRRDIVLSYGALRPDVAAYFKNSAYLGTGYEGKVSAQSLGAGRHTLTFKVLAADGSAYYQPDYQIIVDVTP